VDWFEPSLNRVWRCGLIPTISEQGMKVWTDLNHLWTWCESVDWFKPSVNRVWRFGLIPTISNQGVKVWTDLNYLWPGYEGVDWLKPSLTRVWRCGLIRTISDQGNPTVNCCEHNKEPTNFIQALNFFTSSAQDLLHKVSSHKWCPCTATHPKW
jgi:hypothetical protein